MIQAFKKIRWGSFCFILQLSRLKKKPEVSNINQHKINNKKNIKVFCDLTDERAQQRNYPKVGQIDTFYQRQN